MFLFILSGKLTEFTGTVIYGKDSLELQQLVGRLKPREQYPED